MATLMAGGAIQERFLYGEPVSTVGELTDKKFVAEVAPAFVSYLASDA